MADNQIITYEMGKILYKTASYECSAITEFMGGFPDQPCRTNKMIWLTEDIERALSYGEDLKIFKLRSDVDLYDLMSSESYNFSLEESVKDDEEFKGVMGMVLDIIGEGSLTISDKCLQLYGFLTGSETFNTERQLNILKAIRLKLSELGDIKFNDKSIPLLRITPDDKTFQDVIQEYIEIGDKLSPGEKKINNQRLSIYFLDQILLKLMCHNEKTSALKKDIKGWYVGSRTQTVWTEKVNGKIVSDMGEIALFDCKDLIECGVPEQEPAFLLGKMKHKYTKGKTKRKRKHKYKKKKPNNTKKRKYKKKRKYTKGRKYTKKRKSRNIQKT
jgi:hypothetical protein